MARPLSSGRHHLTRDEVAADQRRRLFTALAEVMGHKGYNQTTVSDLIRHAKVSRATFYQHFDSKQDCFMAGYASMQRSLVSGLESVPASGTPMQRFRAMLHDYLGFLAADPPTARLYLVEVYAAGPEAVRRRMRLQGDFVAGVTSLFAPRDQAGRFACQALVAAISMLVTSALAEGDAASVLALEKPIIEFTESALGATAT